MHKRPVFAVLAVGALALLATACGGDKEKATATTPAAPVDLSAAALVPGADFVAKLDLAAIRATPTCKDFADDAVSGEAEDEATAEDKAKAEKAELRFEEIQRITGLTADDVLSIVISADLETVDLEAEEGSDNLEKVNGVVALSLAKPLTSAKLFEALQAGAADNEQAEVKQIQVAGAQAVHLSSGKPKDPDLYVASGPGERVVFVAGNTASLEGALQRAGSGQFVAIPAPLETVRQTLPAGAQAKLAFLTPAPLQQGIQEQLDKAQKDPEAAMWAGMVAPFKDLKSLGLGVECGAELQIALGGDLGSPEGATQVATMLQTMVLPMAKGGMAKSLGKTPAEIDDRFQVSSEGQALKISVRLTQEDLAGLRKSSEEEEDAKGE